MNNEREELAKLISSRHTMAAVDAILAAGYTKPRIVRASDSDLRARMVDLLLAYKGTPRHELFEYPHRDSDSQRMISDAEAMALKIIQTLNTSGQQS